MLIQIGDKRYLVFKDEDGVYGADAQFTRIGKYGRIINTSRRVKPGTKIFKMIELAIASKSYKSVW